MENTTNFTWFRNDSWFVMIDRVSVKLLVLLEASHWLISMLYAHTIDFCSVQIMFENFSLILIRLHWHVHYWKHRIRLATGFSPKPKDSNQHKIETWKLFFASKESFQLLLSAVFLLNFNFRMQLPHCFPTFSRNSDFSFNVFTCFETSIQLKLKKMISILFASLKVLICNC